MCGKTGNYGWKPALQRPCIPGMVNWPLTGIPGPSSQAIRRTERRVKPSLHCCRIGILPVQLPLTALPSQFADDKRNRPFAQACSTPLCPAQSTCPRRKSLSARAFRSGQGSVRKQQRFHKWPSAKIPARLTGVAWQSACLLPRKHLRPCTVDARAARGPECGPCVQRGSNHTFAQTLQRYHALAVSCYSFRRMLDAPPPDRQ